MDANEQIERFRVFIETYYKAKLYSVLQLGERSIVFDFTELVNHDHELADALLEEPEEVARAAELALEQFDLPEGVKTIRAKFKNLPKSQNIKIGGIRSEHLGKFLVVEGIVRQASDVRPQVTNAKFECAGCGNTLSILQIDTKFKEPSRCTCGWRGRFRLLSKDLIDVQHLKIEESPERLEGGEQPKRISVFLKEDLVDPKMEKKTTPGSKINIYGIVKEVPIQLKTGVQSVRYDLILEANHIEAVNEDFSDLVLSREDEEQIRAIGEDPKAYEKFRKAIAPAIFGHERIKEALVLQLLGGVRKEKPDGTTIRGDIHVLLVGDPGCIAGDSKVSLLYKGMDEIKNLGKFHGEKIKEVVTKIRRDSKDKPYDFATVFQKYEKQPVLKIITESGKEVICTFNQPLLTKESWTRADKLVIGDKVRVMPKIPNTIKKYARTDFINVEKTFGKLKEVNLPEVFTPELASLCGYIIGDGNIHPNGYRVTCYINDEETDLIEQINELWKETFNVEPVLITKEANGRIKTIDDGNGQLRQFVSLQKMYLLEVNSKQVASSLSFLSSKRVPKQIFQSPKNVISKFISWLFDADGCAFGNGRGRTSIQLKSRTGGLLKDVQLLLLYFGIHSRIVVDNLCIRRSYDIELFAKEIGFNSAKKKEALKKVLDVVKNRNEIQKRKMFQRYEKISKIIPFGEMDVYDFEVPVSHSFIANGIVCHNSGKSQLLQFISKVAPKARFVSGKGASGAGLCVAPDSLVTMNPGGIDKIKSLVEKQLKNNDKIYQDGVWCASDSKSNKKIFTLDNNLKLKATIINQFWRIKPPEYVVSLRTNFGKEIITTPNTKLFSISNGNIEWREAETFNEGEYLAGSRQFKFDNQNKVLVLKLIKSNPIVYGVKENLKEIFDLLRKSRDLNTRQLAKELNINENKLYHHWVNNKARGNIHLQDLLKLIEISGYNIENVANNVKSLSLRKGFKLKIPVYLNEDLMYFAGLIAGDGDVSVDGESYCIRFSNNNKGLQKSFSKLSEKLFGVEPYISSKQSDLRAESWRFGSKVIAEVLESLGIYNSPKSDKIDMTNTLLKLPHNLVSKFLSGYFDADGGPVENNKGSSSIEAWTASLDFAKKLQLVLLRYGIKSRLRTKNPKITKKKTGGLIVAKHKKYILTITSKKDLETFRNAIGFGCDYKKNKLNRIILKIKDYDTNLDVVPGVDKIIKELAKKYNIKSRDIFGYKTNNYFSNKFNISISNLNEIVLRLNKIIDVNDEDLMKLNLLANSDIIWEKIVNVKKVYDHNYDFVYDLTVENSHNFIVNGLVIHNTAAVVKDEFLKGWALEAGALVLANKGICVVDELDKIDKEDTAALHSAMEQQIIPISKANIQATLSSQTTLLAAANPKLGRFDPYSPIASQIDLPSTLLNRFDLIFPVRDIPNIEKDSKIALHVLDTATKEETYQTEIPSDFLRKYIAYVKQKIKPKLDKSAIEEIKDFYVTLRNSGTADDAGMKPIPISARQLEGLIRLTEASARLRLSEKATKEDAKRAIDLLRYCLLQVGLDPETGQIDIDRMSGGITASARGKIIAIKDIINNLEGKGMKQIPIEEIMAEAAAKGIDADKVEEAIDQLKKSGDIFEPKRGHISRVG